MKRVLLAALLLLVAGAAWAQTSQFVNRMNFAADPDFQKRVEFAALKTAIAVANEDPTTCCYPAGVTHATATDEQKAAAALVARARVRLAGRVLRGDRDIIVALAKGVVTNLALDATSTDADVEFTVISMWNAFAKENAL